MVFWRKKKNITTQERDEHDERILHRPSDPALEPPTEYDSTMNPDFVEHELCEDEQEILEELEETPLPESSVAMSQDDDGEDDHSSEGGWLSRLSAGLSKSANRMTTGLADIVTKRKLDQAMLDQLEELLIEADLGPKTAARLVEEFAKGRFGKDISDEEIREALAQSISAILAPVAKPLITKKPDSGAGPYVVLVCGVNGVGKTTTIGKLAENLKKTQGLSVMMAAGDTFRAAATEQLQIWAKRTGAPLIAKETGADAAAVAYEAYEQAKKAGVDVLLIDTAGRLQNKKNLMEELQKIVRVLKKQDESLPHSSLLVLDATTGQNAFSQLETFKEMVNVTGLVVTKLDGSAKGGVLVGLADQFGVPVHAIGVGEGVRDMQPFSAEHYARTLLGLEG
jgi:fused signal recognition particle receptor